MAARAVYLIASLSPSRLASLSDGDDKATKTKATMAAEYAAELSNWSGGDEGFN